MPYIEFFGPPGCGKTTAALQMLRDDPDLAPGRRSLGQTASGLHITRIGLPPDGPRMWLYLLSRLPQDAALALRFFVETRSLRSARTMILLLIKGRSLAASPHRWVVDQGLHQLVLDVLARGELRADRAEAWKAVVMIGPWAAERLVEPRVETEELVRRVRSSKKHMAQCGLDSPEDYVAAYVRGARKLTTNGAVAPLANHRGPESAEQR